ncbi:MAG TPA: hypothetical protein VNS34_28415 [Rhizobiaceae bacterium]|nr:hypothetical protein [Rhizobiaceae bacterium]
METASTGDQPAEQSYGEGATTLAMLVPLSEGTGQGRKARDFRDGAALAISELGGGNVRLMVYDTAASPRQVTHLADEARKSGARLIIGPTDTAALAAVAAVPSAQRPPVLSLAGRGASGAGVYTIVSDAVDSALEAARIAIGAGRKSFVAVVPANGAAEVGGRLAQGFIDSKAAFAGVVPYGSPGASLAGEMAAQKALLAKADGVMIFGEGRAPAAVAAALRSASLVKSDVTLIGNLAWTSDNFSNSALDGAIVAMADQSSLAQIAERYRAAHGRAVTMEAAYGYDAVAVAAGIVRQMGPDALTPMTLTKPSGFRGATGTFRLRADGSVERPLALYRFKAGALELVDEAPAAF